MIYLPLRVVPRFLSFGGDLGFLSESFSSSFSVFLLLIDTPKSSYVWIFDKKHGKLGALYSHNTPIQPESSSGNVSWLARKLQEDEANVSEETKVPLWSPPIPRTMQY